MSGLWRAEVRLKFFSVCAVPTASSRGRTTYEGNSSCQEDQPFGGTVCHSLPPDTVVCVRTHVGPGTRSRAVPIILKSFAILAFCGRL